MAEVRTSSERLTTHVTVHEVLHAENESSFARYRKLTFADATFMQFVLFELATIFLLSANGGVGLWLRKKLLRYFFGAFGRNAIIGRNCVFRHPNRIFLGDSVAIDDNCVLDARGCGLEGLHIGDKTIVSRGCIIKSKAGGIRIGRHVNIGDMTQIISHSGVWIGDGAGIGGACQISGGTFGMEEFSKPPAQRTPISNGPIEIGSGAWLATGVLVLDGVCIGEGSVISAGSVVTQSIEPRCVAKGVPAKKVFTIR